MCVCTNSLCELDGESTMLSNASAGGSVSFIDIVFKVVLRDSVYVKGRDRFVRRLTVV